MSILNVLSIRRRWTSIAILFIIVPIGLLVTFRLTGILHEPLNPEVVMVEVVEWNMSRPMEKTDISDRIINFYDDDIVSVNFTTCIEKYHEEWIGIPYSGCDVIRMTLVVATNVNEGYVHSIVIKFSQMDDNAFLDICEDPDWIELQNIQLQVIQDSYKIDEVYIQACTANRTNWCELRIIAFWVFSDENNMDHFMTITSEATYFNGTTYCKVIIPIQLKVYIP